MAKAAPMKPKKHGKGKRKRDGGQAPQFNPPLQDQSGHPNRALSYFVRAVDPDGDVVTYALLNGPPGSQMNPNSGQFTWTPTPQQMGSWPITIQATEQGGGLSTVGGFRVNVINLPPIITPITQPLTVKAGNTLNYFVNANDPEGDLPLAYCVLNGPGGFVGGTNQYSVTPTTPGNFPVAIQVSDSLGGASQAGFQVTVTR